MSDERREFIEVLISLAPWLAIAAAIVWSELYEVVGRRRQSKLSASASIHDD